MLFRNRARGYIDRGTAFYAGVFNRCCRDGSSSFGNTSDFTAFINGSDRRIAAAPGNALVGRVARLNCRRQLQILPDFDGFFRRSHSDSGNRNHRSFLFYEEVDFPRAGGRCG